MTPGALSEPRRQGKGDQKVRNGEQALPGLSEPRVRGIVLACGTMSLVAGMVTVVGLLAGFAGRHMATKRRSAARCNSLHGSEMAGQHPVPTLCPVCRAVQAKDIGYRSHTRGAIRRVIASVAMVSAVAVRWVESAVVAGEWWPRECWMSRRLTPASSRCVAHAWRHVCTEARLWLPLSCRAAHRPPRGARRGGPPPALDAKAPRQKPQDNLTQKA